jgi:hypothetical protein
VDRNLKVIKRFLNFEKEMREDRMRIMPEELNGYSRSGGIN